MADNKQGRDKQAHDERRRQQERDMEEARADDQRRRGQKRDTEETRDRGSEAEPKDEDPGEQLGDLDETLEDHDYPATTDELVEAYGDYEVQTQDGKKSLEEVLAQTDNQTYESADDARSRLQGLIHR